MKSATFQFHGSLNDLLPAAQRNTPIIYNFDDVPAIKHAIETIGVPHTEVDAIIVNNGPVDFFYSLNDNDKIEVYDVKARKRLSSSVSLTPMHIVPEKFILD